MYVPITPVLHFTQKCQEPRRCISLPRQQALGDVILGDCCTHSLGDVFVSCTGMAVLLF